MKRQKSNKIEQEENEAENLFLIIYTRMESALAIKTTLNSFLNSW